MESIYLIDTNTAIDYLDNRLPEEIANFIDTIESHISVITRMELLAWPDATVIQTKILEDFIALSIVHQLTEPIILETIRIRKTYSTKLPDAIIAATAMVNKLTLISRNIRDFKNIAGLSIFNPYLPLQ